MLEWMLAGRFGPLAGARLGALLFPAGALILPLDGPVAAAGFVT
jgi:hypothetical protein